MSSVPPSLLADSSPALLSFANVSKRYVDGGREVTVLAGVSFELSVGGSVGVYGKRRSGKSTLLRLAAAIEPPDGGSVCFDGQDITRCSAGERSRLLRSSVAYLSSEGWLSSPGEIVLDHVAMSVGSGGLTMREAKHRALATLDAVGVSAVGAAQPTASLSSGERARVMLACALVREPKLLVVDEPAPMPSPDDRQKFCALLRSTAREREIALLIASEDFATLGGMGAWMSLSAGGELLLTEERDTDAQHRHLRVAGSGSS
jgi:ABC-type glutathione transport system ATPase component